MATFETHVLINGDRPPFYELAEYLWGANVDYDSDGNSIPASSRYWTELTLEKRPQTGLRVGIDPVSVSPLVFKVVSEHSALVEGAVRFLVERCPGEVIEKSDQAPDTRAW